MVDTVGMPTPSGRRALFTDDVTLSDDGMKVAVATDAALAADDSDLLKDIYVFDRSTNRLDFVTQGLPGSFEEPFLSGNGSSVAFVATDDGIVDGDSNGVGDVFQKDLQTGGLTWISRPAGDFNALSPSEAPVVSDNGRTVLFESSREVWLARDGSAPVSLGEGQTVHLSGNGEAAVWDLVSVFADALLLELVSPVNSEIIPNTELVSLSRNARFAAYVDNATFGDPEQILRLDRRTEETALISANADGFPGNGRSSFSSGKAAISDDGRYAVFVSTSNNLTAGDTNGLADFFIKDLQTGDVERIEREGWATQVGARLSPTMDITISGDGSTIAFVAFGDDIPEAGGTGTGAQVSQVAFIMDNPLFAGPSAGDNVSDGDGGSGSPPPVTETGDPPASDGDEPVPDLGDPEAPAIARDVIVLDDDRNEIDAGDGDDEIYALGGKDVIAGGSGNDVIYDGLGKDRVFGNSGDDVFQVNGGKDRLDGGDGQDVAVFTGFSTDFNIRIKNSGKITVKDQEKNDGNLGKNKLENIEILEFSDGRILVDNHRGEKNPPIDQATLGSSTGASLESLVSGDDTQGI